MRICPGQSPSGFPWNPQEDFSGSINVRENNRMPEKQTPARMSKNPKPHSYKRLLGEVVRVVETGRGTAGRVVNQTITATWWLVGRQIVEHEQRGSSRAGYGEALIARLSIELTKRFGRGFSRRNLAQMKAFYLWKPILQTLSANSEDPGNILQTVSAKSGLHRFPSLPLPWSHYNRLLSVSDDTARTFYEAESIRGGWSVRQLDRQISSLAWQRTRGRPGQLKGESSAPDEIIRDPFVLEFLGLKDEYSETELEDALIHELEAFLLELGNDFTFMARQKRLRVGDEWYRIDLLFFHRRLRCLVILDLKIGKFTHADAGQMNLYLNYAQENWTHPDENPPVGLILCSEKDAAVAHYALGNLTNKVLAREYELALPKERELRARLRKARQTVGKDSK
jgi:predicted nuclease of restriction endonuclease-like (RecB) superfamily